MKNNNYEFLSPISEKELTQRLLEIGVKQEYINNHIDKYFYLIHTIFCNEIYNKQDVNICFLSSKKLSETLGNRYYSIIIDNLIQIGLITKICNYANFDDLKRCNGYILNETDNLEIYESNTNSDLINKLKFKPYNIEKNSVIKERLFRSMNRLTIDDSDLNNLTVKEKIFLFCLKNRQFQKQGEKGGRIYNNFTNIISSLRKKIKLNNEKLFFVDIVNSQMVFFANTIIKYLNENNIPVEQSTKEFATIASTGTVYEMIMNIIDVDRDKAKKSMFTLVFGSNKRSSKLLNILTEKYPQLIETMVYIKKDDYTQFSHLMQQLEAEVIFDAVGYIPFAKDILTIHDSLYSSIIDKDLIKNVLIRSFNTRGIQATININDEYKIFTGNPDITPNEAIPEATANDMKENEPIQVEKIEPVKQANITPVELSCELIDMEEKNMINYYEKTNDKIFVDFLKNKLLFKYIFFLKNPNTPIKEISENNVETVRNSLFQHLIIPEKSSKKFINIFNNVESKNVLNKLLAYKMDSRNRPN
ncbi:hypothetical protein P872_05210 [Rhodonellum psychrophilum GCM71 = DSM 17998]|uniref:Uncharacterized protein n=2 Tax=Rhodonellum TaxID=336827 RepID=U5BYT9_9BACT|nr:MULTISPECIES: hypothetical protein [Rhodonellum]ERM83013.1 hypothetical protein P872_05210 [Rhodonellum psychrophilum GCM71 = DSM 17998]SDZ35869.1 hypothetical protein SAMN05444412_11168 [Rhodonellum ikkaensis]